MKIYLSFKCFVVIWGFCLTFKNERGVCDMLVFEQDVDVKVWVGGIHPVADQKGAILTIQDLQPNPG